MKHTFEPEIRFGFMPMLLRATKLRDKKYFGAIFILSRPFLCLLIAPDVSSKSLLA